MTLPPRIPLHVYDDPLDRIWLTCAERIGFRVTRSPEVYASTDGRGTLIIGAETTLDPDDSLAQMIFHEMCHSLVEGPDALEREDWGLDNRSERDVPREQACLRLQASLAGVHGLRLFLAPTTDFRAFYDALPADPLSPADEPTVVLAKVAANRVGRHPWGPHLEEALAATAEVVRVAAPYAARGSLYGVEVSPPARTPAGFVLGTAAPGETCGTCAWRLEPPQGRARPTSRCRQAQGRRVEDAWPACDRWEPALDCQTCGACCREAYGSVALAPRDPMVKRHPELVVRHDDYWEVARDGERCAALGGGRAPGERYACAIYDERPRTCREFTLGSEHCLTARRRVGLSR